MSTTELIINTYEELKTFRDSVNNGTNSYTTVKLGADIDMNGDDWTPIGFNDGNGTIKTFSGTFDGQGHVISNMKINITDTDNVYLGLFGYSSNYINNLILDNPIIYNSTNNFQYDETIYVSFLCGYNGKSTNVINNCRIINGHININNTGKSITHLLIGCICAHILYSTSNFNIVGCYVEVEFNIKGNILPDFGGIARNNGFLNKCGVKITGIIDLNLKKYSKSILINGLTSLSSTSSLQLKNCYVHMNFKFNIYGRTLSTGYDQLICGIGYNTYSSTPQISNCYVISNIELNTSTLGATYYCVSSNTVTTTNCYSLVNLLLRQYGYANNTYLNNKSETLKYNVDFADDTQNKGSITYKNTYTNSTTLEDDLQSGKICYSLNGDQSEINFYQSLNFDKYPVLDNRHYIVNNPSTGTYTNTSNTDYIFDIWTYDDLMQFKASVNTKGRTAYENKDPVNLHRDFDLNNEKWTPILWFYGTFNGNGHKITNFYMDLADVYYVSDTNSAWGLSFIAAAKVNNFSIETTIKGTYPKTTQLYLAALAYKGSCENVNVFVTYRECNISIEDLYNFYCGGICAIKYSDSDNSFNNCKLNMYFRNCNITISNNTSRYYMYIYGICYICNANNNTVLLSIDNTNTIVNVRDVYISGISQTGYSTLCNSYINCNIDITYLTLGGIMIADSEDIEGNIISCFSFVNFNGTFNGSCSIGGLAGSDISKIQKSYCVSNYNITIKGSYCNIGGICGSAIIGSSPYIKDCYVDANIIYTANDTSTNRIGFISLANTTNETVYYSGSISKTTSSGSITPSIFGIRLSDDAFKSGEVCYKLNTAIGSTVFYQSINSNYYPTFNSNEWEVLYNSSQTPSYYNNIPSFNNTISSYADLITFRNLVNNGTTYNNQTITLLSDIDITGDEWIPIGTSTNLFNGVFDGQNHKISNFKCYANNHLNQVGLFGNATNEIKNLTIENVFIGEQINTNQESDFGSLVGCLTRNVNINNKPSINYCYANNCKILIYEFNRDYVFSVGGLVGNVTRSNIAFCGIKNGVIDIYGGSYIGGLIGWENDTGTIYNSFSEVDITFQMAETNFECILGGLCCDNFITEYCYSINTIKVTNLTDGKVNGLNSSGICNNCHVTTNIDVEINNLYNYGISINGLCGHFNEVSQYNYIDATIAYNILKQKGVIKVSLNAEDSTYSYNYAVNDRITNKGTITPTYTYQGGSYNQPLFTYQFRNGYVCYNINTNSVSSNKQSPFYQTLYSDPYPVLDNTHQPVRNYNDNFYNTLYVLSSRDNILFFYQILDSGYTYENEIIEVSRSFDCSNYKITPSTNAFKGTLEGNNYSIGRFTLFANETANSGFIALNQGTIQNLRLDNVSILDNGVLNSGRNIGFISGSSSGLITNCHVINGYINLQYISTSSNIGGICGWYNSGLSVNPISKCSTNIKVNNIKTSSTGTIRVGGIIGNNGNNNINRDELSISYCCSIIDYNLKISIDSAYYYVGGISSIANNINNSYAIVNFNVQSTGQNSNIFLGGIFGTNISTNLTSMSIVYTNTTITYSRSYSSGVFYIGNVACFDTSSYKSKVYDTNNKVTKLGSYGYSTAFITDTYYTPIIKRDFSNGTVCYGLNTGTLNNPVFYQRINLDEYPLLFGTDSVVSKKGDIYASRIIGITNYQELKNVATLTNSGSYTYSQVQLLNDIDMNNYVNGETWTPIGTSTYKFTASFYGNNHTIYNMVIDAHNKEYNGFIGYSTNSIRNVKIDKSCKIFINTSTLYTNLYIGLLVGLCNYTIYYCDVKGYIDVITKSPGIEIGGLSGHSYNTIESCNVEAIITVEAINTCRIGGFSQYHTSRINYCNVHSQINVLNTVALKHFIGGMLGFNDNSLITKSFCDTRINIIDKYSTQFTSIDPIMVGTTTSSSQIYSPGNLISINNEIQDINYNNTKKYTDITIDQIKNGYLCYNILNNNDNSRVNWKQNLREDYYPILLDSTHETVYKLIDNKVYINKKYNINTFEEFINFRNEINGITSSVTYSCDFYLNCDINLNNIDWIPINYNNYVKFTGTFYGNNHTISKLSLNHSTYQWTGLFGFCSGLKFKDLIISDSTLTVTPKLRETMSGASFIGYKITTIDNCHVKDSYINILNGFNTGYNNEYYAGLGIGVSGYQSDVINCTNCSVSLTYDITDTTTKTSTKNIVISGLISNTVNSTGTSVASSYVENYFTNCKADITFNKFYLNQLRCSCSGICCWMQYVRIENCNSRMNTKNNAIQLINDDTSATFTIELNFAGILANLYNINRYNIQINKCYSYMDIDYSCYATYLCGIALTSGNSGPTQTEAITNCYSNMHIKCTTLRRALNICGISYVSNITNCYSIISCNFNITSHVNSDFVTIGGISRYYYPTYANFTNCYSYLNIYGSIIDSTSKLYFYIGGGHSSSNDTSSKSNVYSIPYTSEEIYSSLSGSYVLYNNCTTDYVTAITKDDFTNGKVCYGLNGNQSNINFYQYLKESNYPTLDSNYPKVLLKNSSYINQETITEINSKYDLFLFRDSVNAGNNYVDTTININVDIDLENMEWTPINNIDFDGILQGNNHTISNFTIQNQSNFMIYESMQACGFFDFLFETAEIHNLTLNNVTIQGEMSKGDQDDIVMFSCGVLCGFERKTNISNCNITNCKIDIAYSNNTSSIVMLFIGGLIGMVYNSASTNTIITNCNVINTSIKIICNSDILSCYVCGLFAIHPFAESKTQLINSSFIGNITFDNTDGINTYPNDINGLCIGLTDINSCYTINNIKIINGRNAIINGISHDDNTITNTYCKSIINVSSYTTIGEKEQISISGISYGDVSTTNINNVYADNQIFYNNQTTDATKIQIGKISCQSASTVANSTINIVPNQIINLGTTEATINDKVTDYKIIRKEDFSNGKVCYGLNNGGTYFYQIIGMDAYPVLTNNNSTIKQLTISMHPSPLNEFYYNNDFDGNICSYYDLCLFRNLVNSGTNFQGQTINLLCDIDMNGDEWIPIGVNGFPFRGSFNGNNHVIKNMVLRLNLSLGTTNPTRYIGLFGVVGSTTQTTDILIRDIIIDKSCQMKYDSYSGIIYSSYVVGYFNKGTIDNCKVYANVNLNNNIKTIYYASFAGFIRDDDCIISNCYANNNVVINNSYIIYIYGIAFMDNNSNGKTSKLINNGCIMNVRVTHKSSSTIQFYSLYVNGLSYGSLPNDSNVSTINPNNCNNNYCLMNTTILNDILPYYKIDVLYSMDKLNSNNYVNNDYPFIKNPTTKTQISLGSYDSKDFKSGKICYLLNGDQLNIKFYQNLEINKDIAPILDNSHQQVYKSTIDDIDTYYNRPLNELPTQQLAVTTYNLANQSTPLYNYDPYVNRSSTNLYIDKINFALSTGNSFYSVTQPLEKYFYDIYHSSKKYKIHTNNIMRLNFHLFNQLIQSKITIGDVIMYNEIFAKLINNLPLELIKTELNYYKRLCFYLRDKNALDTEHYNLIFGDN